MTRRRPIESDHGLLVSVMRLAWPNQQWDEAAVAARMAEAGAHLVDPESLAYCHLTTNKLEDALGPVPAGPCTQISTLAPQHHDQQWVDEKLAPLLEDTLRDYVPERAGMLDFPLYGLLPTSLIRFWEGKLGSTAYKLRGRSSLIYVPTLREAMRGL